MGPLLGHLCEVLFFIFWCIFWGLFVADFGGLLWVLFMALFGWRLVKIRKSNADLEMFDVKDYLFKLKVGEKSKLIGVGISDFDSLLAKNNVSLITIVHRRQKIRVFPANYIFAKNDLLFLEGSQKDVDIVLSTMNLSLVGANSALRERGVGP